MASLEHLDLLLGDAIERILKAADEMRKVKEFKDTDHLRRAGRVIAELWAIREKVYEIDPSIKRDFLVEHEADKTRFEELNAIAKKANQSEQNNQLNDAIELYSKLYKASNFGYFQLLAEAGLFRAGGNKASLID